MTDFIKLAKLSQEPNLSNEEKLKRNDTLYGALFELPIWLFAINPKSDEFQPLIRDWEGKKWIFGFTDSKLLEEFLKRENLQKDGDTLYISMSIENALPWFRKLIETDVYGVNFNFAGHGWYIPLKQMDPINNHLKHEKK